MLPSSHLSPIVGPAQVHSELLQAGAYKALPSQGEVQTSATALALAEAFSDFVSTSSRLESSYRELQGEIAGLREELGKRNEDLRISLSENQRVRLELQQIVDCLPCGVIVATAAGRISTINPEVSRTVGSELFASVPETLHELKDVSGLDLNPLLGSQAGGDNQRELHLRSASGDRSLQILERSLPKSTADENASIFVISDITEQKRAERNREAARNAAVLAQITTMLAHEIRNPLGSLELFAELIEQDATGRNEWISHLRAGIRTLSGTVNNVLTMNDGGFLNLKELTLDQTMISAVHFAEPVAAQAGIALRWSSEASGVKVLGNESALQQVLLNLIRNAIRHTPAGGAVHLEITYGAEGTVDLACSDTGAGIPPEHLARLFEAGFSGSNDTPGLGLAVCDRIMQQHGGSIRASNAEHSGARFVLSFPSFQQELATAS